MRRLGFLWLLALCSCTPQLHPQRTDFDTVPGWKEAPASRTLSAFRRSCNVLAKKPGDAMIGSGTLRAPAAAWQETCAAAAEAPSSQAREFFEAYFTPFTVGDDGLFTGYYEPMLLGSRTRHGVYQTAVYRLPPDVKAGIPYYTRAEINNGVLAHRGLELLWVDDPVMLFFAEVQGTAKVRLTNGHTIRIGYAGKNNQPYVAIGKMLKTSGELKKVNFFTLRAWLYDHPSKTEGIMEQNLSYVFFRELPAAGGPIGAEKVALTTGRSLAIDPHFIPYGMPLFVQLTNDKFQRLMVAQDAGGAIKGPVRGDIFFGSGAQAEEQAGMMQSRGTYILLVPNVIAEGM